ncbi:MAG: prepilin peptidase [Thermoguttaceae bacterium]
MPPFDITVDSATCLIGAWIFAMGGSIGSFLNVAVYRLPGGMSLVQPGSHCPACKHAIRWFDNVPILGWLMLRGRCRDCGAGISARYPIVEGITASMFLLLGSYECLGGGVNLPVRSAESVRTVAELFGIYAYHLLLLCTLLAAGLMEFDGHRPWRSLFLPAILGGLIGPLIWPHLHPVPAGLPWLDGSGWILGLTDGMAGLAAGLLLGWVARLSVSPERKIDVLMCPACVGLFLGWQAVFVLLIGAMALDSGIKPLRTRFPAVRTLSPTVWLLSATIAWIVFWSQIVEATQSLV